MFVNNLPVGILSPHCYGSADDVNVLESSQEQLCFGLRDIDDWRNHNIMRVNVSKSALFNFRGIKIGRLQEEELCAITQKDLELHVNKSLSWYDKCPSRTRKGLSAFFSLKRNFSNNSSLVVKMNGYRGYVSPVLAYCSQAWHPNIQALTELEKIQISSEMDI